MVDPHVASTASTTNLWTVALGSGGIAGGLASLAQLWVAKKQRDHDFKRDHEQVRREAYADYLVWLRQIPRWIHETITNDPVRWTSEHVEAKTQEFARIHWEVMTPVLLVASKKVKDLIDPGARDAFSGLMLAIQAETTRIGTDLATDADLKREVESIGVREYIVGFADRHARDHLFKFVDELTDVMRAEFDV